MKLVPKFLERGFLGATFPLAEGLRRLGISPNTITTVGALFVVVSAVAYGLGSIRLGGILLLGSGVVDTLDGQVARHGDRVSKFGAFYDSTLDRVGDGATFIGIAIFFLLAPVVPWRTTTIAACMVAVWSSLLVSYARARAEGLGLECKVGLVQRAERLVALGAASILLGGGPYEVLALQIVVAALAFFSIITVIQRFIYVHRITRDERT